MPNINSQGYKARTPELHRHLYDIDRLARQESGISVEQNPSLPLILTDSNFYEYNLRYVHQPPIERSSVLQEILGADSTQGPAIEDFALISQTRVDTNHQSQIQTVYRGEQSSEYVASNMRISVKSLADRALRNSVRSNLVLLPNHIDRLMSDVFELSVDNLYTPVDRLAESNERQDLKKRIRTVSKNIFDYHDTDTFTDNKPHIVRYRSGSGHRPVDIALQKAPEYRYSQQQNQTAKQSQKIDLSLQQLDKQVIFSIHAIDSSEDMKFTTYRPISKGMLDPIIDEANLDIHSEIDFIANFLKRLEANADHSSFDTPDGVAAVEPLPHLENHGVDEFINRFFD